MSISKEYNSYKNDLTAITFYLVQDVDSVNHGYNFFKIHWEMKAS